MKAVVWEPPARQEYDDALAVSRDAAALQRVIDDALREIVAGRVTHAKVGRSGGRWCILSAIPYSIVYIDAADEIRVYALIHHKRRTNYWKQRLPQN